MSPACSFLIVSTGATPVAAIRLFVMPRRALALRFGALAASPQCVFALVSRLHRAHVKHLLAPAVAFNIETVARSGLQDERRTIDVCFPSTSTLSSSARAPCHATLDAFLLAYRLFRGGVVAKRASLRGVVVRALLLRCSSRSYVSSAQRVRSSLSLHCAAPDGR